MHGYLSGVGNTFGSLHFDFGAEAIFDLVRVWNDHGFGQIPGRSEMEIRMFDSSDAAAFGNKSTEYRKSMIQVKSPSHSGTSTSDTVRTVCLSPQAKKVREFERRVASDVTIFRPNPRRGISP